MWRLAAAAAPPAARCTFHKLCMPPDSRKAEYGTRAARAGQRQQQLIHKTRAQRGQGQ